MSRSVRLVRGATTGVGTAAVLLASTPDRAALVAGLADADRWVQRDGLDLVLAQLVGAVAWLAALWLAAGFALVAGARLPGAAGRLSAGLARRALPVGLRGTAALTLGVSLATSAVPALAARAGSAAAATSMPLHAAVGPTDPTAAVPATGPHGWAAVGGSPVDWPVAGSKAAQVEGSPGRSPVEWPPADAGRTGCVVDWPVDGEMDRAGSRRPDRAAAAPVDRTGTAPGDTGEVGAAGARRPDRAVPADRVRVAPGDTLWSIASRRLGPGAPAPAVAAEWRRWHAANRELIGPDPRRLRPGVVLRVPDTA